MLAAIGLFVAAIYEPSVYGEFASAYSVSTALITLLISGVLEYLLVTKYSDIWEGLFKKALFVTVLVYVFFICWLFLYGGELFFLVATWLLFYRMLTAYFSTYFQKRQLYGRLFYIQISQSIGFLFILLYVFMFYIDLDKTIFFAAWVASLIIMSSVLYKLNFSLGSRKHLQGNVFRASWRYSLAALLSYAYMTSSIVIIRYVVGPEEAGIYALALSFLLMVFSIFDILYKYYLNKFSEVSSGDRGGDLLFIMVFLGGCAVSFLYFNLPVLVSVFGVEYTGSQNILKFIIPLIYVHAFIFYFVFLLTVNGMLKDRNKVQVIVALIAVLLNAILVINFNINGAVWGFITSEVLLFVGYFYMARNLFKIRNVSRVSIAFSGVALYSFILGVLSLIEMDLYTSFVLSMVLSICPLFLYRESFKKIL